MSVEQDIVDSQGVLTNEFGPTFPLKVIKIMLQDGKSLGRLKKFLDPGLFGTKEQASIVGLIYSYFETNAIPPTLDILEHLLNKHLTKFPNLKEDDRALYAKSYKDIREMILTGNELAFFNDSVKDWIAQRSWERLTRKLVKDYNDGKLDWEKAFLDNQHLFDDLNAKLKMSQAGLDYVGSVTQRIERRNFDEEDSSLAIPTLINKLDSYLKYGGIMPTYLYAVQGSTGKGKTHVLIHMAYSALVQGKAVVYFSLGDMSEWEIYDRIDSKSIGVEYKYLNAPEHENQLRNKMLWLSQTNGVLKTIYAPPDTLNIYDLKNTIQDIQQELARPIDLCVVDYGSQLLPSIQWKEFRHVERQKFVDLKRLAMELGIGIWTGIQGNRESEGKATPGMKETSEAYRINDILDLNLTIGQTEEEASQNLARLILAKNRGGIDKIAIKVLFNKSISNIADWEGNYVAENSTVLNSVDLTTNKIE